MTTYGYARVSTKEQSLDAQLEELKSAGCDEVFREKITAKVRERPQLIKLLKNLGPGDLLIISRLDRLARSSRDLLNLIHEVSEAGACFKSLKETWADTTTAHGRLMVTILGGLAEFERELILQRTGEGRERAKADGKKFGRKPKLTYHQQQEAKARREAGESFKDVAASYNVHHTAIRRLCREVEAAS